MQAGTDGASPDGASAGARQMQQGSLGQGSQATQSQQNSRSAQDALNQLSSDAAAAAERQRAASQLEASRNAMERALGRTQSRTNSSTGRSSSQSSSQRGQSSTNQGDPGQGGAQGQGDQLGADGAEPSGGGANPGQDSGSGDGGQGGGYSTGGQSPNRTGAVSNLDTITRPEQVPNSGGFTPDQSQQNPYLGDAGSGSANANDESVQPSFTRKPTQGNDTGSIPLGLRDLVKDYFSSLDQK
jgi:hypothetical protein